MSTTRVWHQGARFPDNPQTSGSVLKMHRALLRCPEALLYLERRGIDPDVMVYYGVGFQEQAADVLYNRVTFPMTDWDGHPLTQQGRVIPNEVLIPHYPNVKYRHYSFPSGRFLYGIREALPWIMQTNYVVVVEGPLNVLTLAHYGIPAVASFGTGFSNYQAHLLSRFTSTIVLGQDFDEAGEKAAVNAGEVFKKAGSFEIYRAVPGEAGVDWNDAHLRQALYFDPVPIEEYVKLRNEHNA